MANTSNKSLLTPDQIATFLRDGVLVVEDILSPDEIQTAKAGLSQSLQQLAGVETSNLRETGHGLTNLSSTNGSGGVLDVFYQDWQCQIATHPKLWQATTELWEAAYCHQGESRQELVPVKQDFRWHPHGKFDFKKGYCYLDRVGFRLPTELATQLGLDLLQQHTQEASPQPTSKKKKKKAVAIQRSLTPHLDCCPETFLKAENDNGNKTAKWRPIQCFVSLSDTLEPNHGGFEAAVGFHQDFDHWSQTRSPTRHIVKHKQKVKGQKGALVVTEEEIVTPAPCIGEYTHIRPTEDKEVMQRVQHIPGVKAGSAVFFDNRIPHANSYRHEGQEPRCVVYCSFLPDVPVNRRYASQQLVKFQQGIAPNDQWIDESKYIHNDGKCQEQDQTKTQPPWLIDSPLARKLMAIEPW